jgi:prepilin-type processing-associated H-X9-DG protein
VAPFVDEQTVAVAHLDLSRPEVEPLLARFGLSAPLGDALRRWLAGFARAGGKELFVVMSLADLAEGPFILVPLTYRADSRAIAELLGSLPGAGESREKLDGVVFAGGKATLKRLRQLKPAPRPELARAFAAAGDAAGQVLLLPTADSRRVIEELFPTLPRELGGGPSTVLTHGLEWAALGVNTTPGLSLRLTVQSRDAQAAGQFGRWAAARLKALAADKEVRQSVPDADKLAALLTPAVVEDRLSVTLAEQQLAELLQPAMQRVREASERTKCANNLKQIGIAFHSYYDVHKVFPTAASYGKDGKPLLSWRVHLLPFLEQEALYKEFKLDEPWDSAHNKKLIDRMPAVYRCGDGKPGREGLTTYLAPLGEATMFPGRQPVRLPDVTDGTSNTIFIVDAADDRAVVWTRPDDLKYDPTRPLAGLLGRHRGGFQALFVDGSVRMIAGSIDPKTLHALFTRNGGEAVDVP